MPFAESSPVRQMRSVFGWSQRELAEKTGLSASTISTIERLRNPNWVEALAKMDLEPTLTTLEVAVRICAAFGLLKYGRQYTIREVARKVQLFNEQGLTDRTARCARPYPGRRQQRHSHLHLVTAAVAA